MNFVNHTPQRWKRAKLKYLGRFVGGGTPSKEEPAFWNGSIPWVSPKDMKSSTVTETEDHITNEAINASSTSLVQPHAVLMVVRSGILKHTIPVATNLVTVTLNQDMKAFLPGGDLLSSFVQYLITGNQNELLVGWRKAGATVESLEQEYISNTIIAVPPLSEQRAIAAFLDRKTAEIDAVIARKERLIALLQEERQALISRAVTRGLEAGAAMKDSGISWLGEVPKHWKIAKLLHYANVFNGCTPSRLRSDYWDGDIPWLSSGAVNDYLIDSPAEWISAAAFRECSLTLVPKGAVVVGMIGQGKTRGMSARLGIETCINQNMAAIVPNHDLDSQFLHYVFICGYEELREQGRGGNQEALNCELLGAFRIPLPPLSEQQAISAFLDRTTNRIARLVRANADQITKLREYRQALISAAVTGKLAVPQEAPS